MAGERQAEAAASPASATATAATAHAAPGPDPRLSARPQAAKRPPITDTEILLARALARARYHEDREAFLGLLMRCLNCAVLFSGTAAFAFLTRATPTDEPKWIAAATAFIGAIQLVFDLPGLIRTHAGLRKVAVEVVADASVAGADIEALSLKLIRSAVEDPPTYHALEALAYNAAQCAIGREGDDTLLCVPWLHRVQRNWRRFSGGYKTPSEIRAIKAARWRSLLFWRADKPISGPDARSPEAVCDE